MTIAAPWAEPHGAYAILALLALAALGAAIAPSGVRGTARNTRRIVAAAVLVGAALALLWPQITRRPALDEHPQLADPIILAGTWRDGTDTLTLQRDGTYRCSGLACTGFGARGAWSADTSGAMAVRWSDGHAVTWRVVSYNGRYRLALMPASGSGASWEGRLSFEQVQP